MRVFIQNYTLTIVNELVCISVGQTRLNWAKIKVLQDSVLFLKSFFSLFPSSRGHLFQGFSLFFLHVPQFVSHFKISAIICLFSLSLVTYFFLTPLKYTAGQFFFVVSPNSISFQMPQEHEKPITNCALSLSLISPPPLSNLYFKCTFLIVLRL